MGLAANKSMFGIAGISGFYAMKHKAFVTEIDQGEIANAFLVIARRGSTLPTTNACLMLDLVGLGSRIG